MRDITDAEFETVVASGKVLVDFYSEWCQPCKPLAKVLEKLAPEFPEITFVKLDISENEATTARYGVGALPTLILFEDGQPVREQLGGMSASAMKEWLKGV